MESSKVLNSPGYYSFGDLEEILYRISVTASGYGFDAVQDWTVIPQDPVIQSFDFTATAD